MAILILKIMGFENLKITVEKDSYCSYNYSKQSDLHQIINSENKAYSF